MLCDRVRWRSRWVSSWKSRERRGWSGAEHRKKIVKIKIGCPCQEFCFNIRNNDILNILTCISGAYGMNFSQAVILIVLSQIQFISNFNLIISNFSMYQNHLESFLKHRQILTQTPSFLFSLLWESSLGGTTCTQLCCQHSLQVFNAGQVCPELNSPTRL